MSISLKEISERTEFINLFQDDMCSVRGIAIKDNHNNKRLFGFGYCHLWNNTSWEARKYITINNVTINDSISFNASMSVTETGSSGDQVYGTYLGGNTFEIGIKQFNGNVPDCRVNILFIADIL